MSADEMQVGGQHYKNLQLQPWAVMEAWMAHEQFIGFLMGCVLKRLARWQNKDGLQDLKKARHELDKLIEVLESRKSDGN